MPKEYKKQVKQILISVGGVWSDNYSPQGSFFYQLEQLLNKYNFYILVDMMKFLTKSFTLTEITLQNITLTFPALKESADFDSIIDRFIRDFLNRRDCVLRYFL